MCASRALRLAGNVTLRQEAVLLLLATPGEVAQTTVFGEVSSEGFPIVLSDDGYCNYWD